MSNAKQDEIFTQAHIDNLNAQTRLVVAQAKALELQNKKAAAELPKE